MRREPPETIHLLWSGESNFETILFTEDSLFACLFLLVIVAGVCIILVPSVAA